MRAMIVAGLLLAVLSSPFPSFAKDDPSDEACNLGACAVLSAAAIPVLIGASGVCLTVGTGESLVRFVDSAGKGLSELTVDSFESASHSLCDHDCPQRVTIKKKEIPLVVRKDYLELNEKVKTQ
jgi:hypothetical protein